MVTKKVVLAVEAESAPELIPLPFTVTVYIPALDRGGAGEPDPQPSTGSNTTNKAMPSVVSHFRRPCPPGSRANPNNKGHATKQAAISLAE
jgi:hypothetical protein